MSEKLALHGGKPVRTKILPFVPEQADIGPMEINAAVKVLRSKKLSQLSGEEVANFEKEFAEYYGIKNAIATSSGTTALHAALAGLGVGPGDDVILPPYTFMATANAILHQNGVPIFADIDPETCTISAKSIEERVTKYTKVVMPVHMVGNPAEMDDILKVAREKNLFVVEDCAQAGGGEYKGKKVGTFGDIGCFSFYLNKNITAGGEGGMAITNNDALADKIHSIINHCRVKESPYPNVPAHNVYWGIGYNYRMTAVQAAIGRIQLKKLDKLNEVRRRNAQFLARELSGVEGVSVPSVRPYVKHVYWAFSIRILQEKIGVTRDQFSQALLKEGIKAEGYCPIPVHLQEVFRKKVGYGNTHYPFDSPLYKGKVEYKEGLCPSAEKLSKEDLLLPVYPTLTQNDLKDVVHGVKKVATFLRA
nr:DegT/DnrJ/EryC1/StrS family aminotransferase [Candidatus Njordarchaeum guaymaensis]